MKIENIIFDCIKKHEGGEKFFDALDDTIRNTDVLFPILKTLADSFDASKHFPYTDRNKIKIIVSGRFGIEFKKFYPNCFLVNGNLRPDNNYVDDVFMDDFKFHNKSGDVTWIFVDDSYFLGRTANKIRDFVEDGGGTFGGIVVAYDGSVENKKHNLKCLYRYYDNFKEGGAGYDIE